MTLIDGKKVADTIKEEIAAMVEKMLAEGKKRPHLAAILVGHDGGSETYVAHKVRACEQCGFKSTLIRFEADVTEERLLEAIDTLNRDEDVDGFIVQPAVFVLAILCISVVKHGEAIPQEVIDKIEEENAD